jgi:prepilin-type N-terminal cleavage/methylation domain-containing protein
MNRMAFSTRFERGFTIIESLVVAVVLGIAAAAIVSLQGPLFSQQSSVDIEQRRTRVLLECGEQILGINRGSGIDAVDSTACNSANLGSAQADFSLPTVTPYTLSAGADLNAICHLGATCKLVTVQDGSTATTDGRNLAVLLVDYY